MVSAGDFISEFVVRMDSGSVSSYYPLSHCFATLIVVSLNFVEVSVSRLAVLFEKYILLLTSTVVIHNQS